MLGDGEEDGGKTQTKQNNRHLQPNNGAVTGHFKLSCSLFYYLALFARLVVLNGAPPPSCTAGV